VCWISSGSGACSPASRTTARTTRSFPCTTRRWKSARLINWPRAYLLQMGDSRCYLLRGGELTQITRDQTMAQELIDLGVLTRADASSSRLSHTLSSSIGGRQTAPVVTRIGLDWDTVVLLCSDGLSRHVPDERIRERLRSITSARQVCEDLVQDALDAGGQDNITVVVRRAVVKEG